MRRCKYRKKRHGFVADGTERGNGPFNQRRWRLKSVIQKEQKFTCAISVRHLQIKPGEKRKSDLRKLDWMSCGFSNSVKGPIAVPSKDRRAIVSNIRFTARRCTLHQTESCRGKGK
jgi:hypothetical protein